MSAYLAVVDVYLTVGPGEPVLAQARVAGHAVHARGARGARVLLALVNVYGAVLACKVRLRYYNLGNEL